MTAELNPEKIKQWTAEGHWPPGMTVLENRKVDPEDVKKFARLVASILPPAERKVIEEAFHLTPRTDSVT